MTEIVKFKSLIKTSSMIDFIPVRMVSKTRNILPGDKKVDIGHISDRELRTNRILVPNEGRQTTRKKRLRRRKRKQRRRSKSLAAKTRKNNLLSELDGLGKKKEIYEKIIKSYIKNRVKRRKKKLRSQRDKIQIKRQGESHIRYPRLGHILFGF